jgi:hypothetical protein
MSAAVLLTSAATSVLLGANAPIVVLGPGSLDMRLLTAKLAAKSGFDTTLFAGQGAQQLWWEQMYGEEYIAGEQVEGRASLLSGNDEREAALGAAEGLCIISDGAALPATALASVLEAAPSCRKVVLMSKMGVTRAEAGPLGLGKEGVEQKDAEQRLRAACSDGDLDLSIVRVGTLKGGGPGDSPDGSDVGLARPYYDNIFDVDQLRMTRAHDRRTLGAKCTRGDPFDLVNSIVRLTRKGSFEPQDDETNRAVACAAAIAALRHSSGIEFSVSAAEGETIPTSGQWEAILNQL